MLPCLRRLDRPRHVQMIRQGVVDRLDLRISQQLFVRPVSLRDSQRLRRFLPLLEVARSDRRNVAPFSFLHPRNHLADRDARRAQNTPLYFSLRGHRLPPSRIIIRQAPLSVQFFSTLRKKSSILGPARGVLEPKLAAATEK